MAGKQAQVRPSLTLTLSAGERQPLLANGSDQPQPEPRRKPFYRARPLWLVPFTITAALVRGMTLAPRVEVYTQLACASIHHTQQQTSNYSLNIPNLHTLNTLSLYSTLDPLGPHLPERYATTTHYGDPIFIEVPNEDDDSDDSEDDPRKLPSSRCLSDPAVGREAARIQTTLTTTMGLLTVFTTGWWGHFSERHGRTRVLGIATLGLLLTDITFILVATPGSPLSSHGHKLLVIAPIIEGLLGGWSTLQSATSAYVSDCTSSGSRAKVFSRFNGVFFLGVSVGPIIGSWVIRNGIPGIDRIGTITKEGKSVTEVFWLSICLSTLNFLLTAFLFPESLSKEQQAKAKLAYQAHGDVKGKSRSTEDVTGRTSSAGVGDASEPLVKRKDNFLKRFFSPLALFLPVMIAETTSTGVRKRKDWSLTFLTMGMFTYMLSTGLFQIKYLYAVKTYQWAADQLSYYISLLSGLRAFVLLFLLPYIISTFKPKSPPSTAANGTGKDKKPKPTKGRIAGEINFDLFLARCSLAVDILSQAMITIVPAPDLIHHMREATASEGWVHDSTTTRTVLFVFASSLSSVGSGFIPACQSLALCIVQARQLLEGSESVQADNEDTENAGEQDAVKTSGDTGIGKLFGALAMLQALGQAILGPLLFGLVYGTTVGLYPKAVFVVAGGILTVSLTCALMVRSPVEKHLVSRKNKKRVEDELERGRSRASKDLFGATSSASGSREHDS